MRFIEKITNDWNIKLAISKVKSNKGAPGMDHMTVDEIDEYFKENGRKIEQKSDK